MVTMRRVMVSLSASRLLKKTHMRYSRLESCVSGLAFNSRLWTPDSKLIWAPRV